jgi:diaminohydroxyphosphoribosylaminopyrimidine deaminase/5-amino-6-(5-phosphoribosylamino)uracil reductase
LDDKKWMARTIELALRGGTDVRPNPMVGCVVVGSTGEALGVGWHQRFGRPHAEVHALDTLEDVDLSGATLYVNLEPCSFHGKTPPCADLIVERGVGTVVIGALDPNPRVAGAGAERLRQAGVTLRIGVLEKECRSLNAGFLTRMTLGRPHVTLKMAQSLDGFAAPQQGTSRWITGEPARKRVHAMRSWADAVLTGPRTILADDPGLTVRDAPGRSPLRIVLDAKGVVPDSAKVLSDGNRTLIVRGPQDPRGRIDLKSWIQDVDLSILYVLVEAGPTLSSAFLAEELVDELAVFTAPILMGGGMPSFTDPARETLAQALRPGAVHYEQIGLDMLTTLSLRQP